MSVLCLMPDLVHMTHSDLPRMFTTRHLYNPGVIRAQPITTLVGDRAKFSYRPPNSRLYPINLLFITQTPMTNTTRLVPRSTK